MPAYVSHAIMARDVYNKIDNKNVDFDCMITFSQGADLSKFSKCRRDSHRIKTGEFINRIADYMIENNLTNDKECLGLLYGHICHYAMDVVVHPLVRSVDRACKNKKGNHSLIEGYYDSYLSNEKCNKRIDLFDNNLVFKAKMDKKLSKLINDAYYKVYDTKNLSFYYKLNLMLYKQIKYLYILFSLNTLKRFSGFNKFISNNENVDLLNNDRSIEYLDYENNKCNDNLDTLYDESVDLAVNNINDINKKLYKKRV